MHIGNSTVFSTILNTYLYLSAKTFSNVDSATVSDVGEAKCYGVYGCFPLNGPWISKLRHMNVHPESPSKIHPLFPVFTSKNTEFPHFIDLNDPDGVRNFGINPNGKIFIISHGFLEAGDKPWLQAMAKTLLNSEPEGTASVIIVDWHGGSSPPYVQAVANTRVVGAIAGHIINLVYEELHMPNLDKVHFIGHSLGSHIAGYAGHTLQKDFGIKLGRITGLDPAEPLFGETDPIVRLDRSDAKYVDIIHTDAIPGGLGMIKPIGHLDFFPNGGFDNPGCAHSMNEGDAENAFFSRLSQAVSCNHVRSYQFFTESINTKCPFIGISCDSYESFQAGECFRCDEDDHYCFRFGMGSISSYNQLKNDGLTEDDIAISAFLMTAPGRPFCRVHYRITVKISASDESALHGGEIGTLSIKLHSHSRKETEKMSFYPEPFLFEPGLVYTSVVAGLDIGETLYATASWDYQTNLLNPLTWRILASPRIYIDYLIIDSLEYKDRASVMLCPVYQSPIIAGSPNMLQTEYCTTD